MDFARQQRDPTRHLIGITFVIVLHVIVIYALVTGLARKAIEVIKKPLTATIVEEIKAPPPPPPPPKKIEITEDPAAAAGLRAAAGRPGPDHAVRTGHRRGHADAAAGAAGDYAAGAAGAACGEAGASQDHRRSASAGDPPELPGRGLAQG